MSELTPFEQGRQAWFNLQSDATNPYDHGDETTDKEKASQWMDGYYAAEEEVFGETGSSLPPHWRDEE